MIRRTLSRARATTRDNTDQIKPAQDNHRGLPLQWVRIHLAGHARTIVGAILVVALCGLVALMGNSLVYSDASASSFVRWRAASRNASAIAVVSPSSPVGRPLSSEFSA